MEAGGSIWVAYFLTGRVQRIDPATNRVAARVPAGDRPIGLTYANGSVWVGDFGDGAITRIDAATNTVTRRAVVASEHETVTRLTYRP